MLKIGSLLDGKYKILSEIDRGGMSIVYLALNEKANKTWAVKEVRKDGGNDVEIVKQSLAAETEMLKKLNHPNLPSIIDVIESDDAVIIVMDYVEGRDLQKMLDETKREDGSSDPVDPELVLDWAKQLCDVLGYLHSRKPPIIYRDLKPSNIMLCPDGRIEVIDFGTAREYKQYGKADTKNLGTRGYAAPEQFGNKGQTDARTDIFNLGATMYHLLTGYSPIDTNFQVLPLGELIPYYKDSGLEKLVAKCCMPDPKDRYQDCTELMFALEHVHDLDEAAVRERNKKWKIFVSCVSLMLVGIIGMVGFNIMHSSAAKNSYESKISEASNAQDFDKKATLLTEAMSIRPEQAIAYNALLDAVMEPDSDDGISITKKEEDALTAAIESKAGRRNSPNIDEFNRQNHEEYLDFQINRGTKYFDYYKGSKKRAESVFKLLESDSEIDDKRKGLCSCLSTICNIYITNTELGGKSEGTISSYQDKSSKYKEAWNALKEIAGDETTVDSKTGGTFYSALLYREIAKQVTLYQTYYEEAQIKTSDMMDLLDTGSSYLEGASADGDKGTEDMIRQASEAIAAADKQLNRTHNSELGMYDNQDEDESEVEEE